MRYQRPPQCRRAFAVSLGMKPPRAFALQANTTLFPRVDPDSDPSWPHNGRASVVFSVVGKERSLMSMDTSRNAWRLVIQSAADLITSIPTIVAGFFGTGAGQGGARVVLLGAGAGTARCPQQRQRCAHAAGDHSLSPRTHRCRPLLPEGEPVLYATATHRGDHRRVPAGL
jgi:hypothetical protein